ncbi:MAG: hypothetical protein EBT77_02295 [Verrucomicrobia bacterium]|nr:hypothetical protein [Verrucomicrobiota bacterium]
MARQLIFTSVPRGLAPGSSGYCTAARSAALRPGLVQKLEQMSVYAHRVSAPHPVLLTHRVVEVGGEKYHVVSRIREAGLDFTLWSPRRRVSIFPPPNFCLDGEVGAMVGGRSLPICKIWMSGGWREP